MSDSSYAGMNVIARMAASVTYESFILKILETCQGGVILKRDVDILMQHDE